jgi:redox-sensitive bicupin YhaK (pirin superfamily)
VLLLGRDGEAVALRAGNGGARYLLIAGAPLNEPIAWHGPIVMNTEQDLKDAFRELQEGTFIKR